jgi:hypothetical protein
MEARSLGCYTEQDSGILAMHGVLVHGGLMAIDSLDFSLDASLCGEGLHIPHEESLHFNK